MVLAVACGVLVGAQQDARLAALDAALTRIFTTRDFAVPSFGPARWSDDGRSYSTVEAAAAPAKGREIVRYDAETGAREVLVAAPALTPAGKTEPLSIDDYAWSADRRKLLVFTNTERVWRDNTRGDYWVLDLDTRRLTQIAPTAPASSLLFAKFSPDATRVAYVRANNLYVERLSDGRITPLTRDGSATIINGTSDWVYEEELGLRDAFRWSPDGQSIAYWRFDSSGVGEFSLINNTDSVYPAITRIPYPKAGTANSAVRIGVVPAKGGKTRWMDTPGDPRQTYLARMEWLDDRTLVMQQLNRLQNQNDVLRADVKSGVVTPMFRDATKTWVDVVDDMTWIDNGRAFLWPSERGAWRHVYRVPAVGRPSPTPGADASAEPRVVTNFDADAISMSGVDEAGGWLYFIASPARATERYLYRSRLDGSGTPERVTPADQIGTHAYTLAPNARLAFHTYSRFDRPPVTDLIELPSHRVVRALTDITALTERLAPLVQ
ncbi:MAG: DPP IV N-terminal domain-containing protein, partial [Acidobacteria bacterium]|nr:DPP IV N-terminal domain-containing protein [Acidobacteriota bacterium]